MQEIEVNLFEVDFFSNLREKIHYSYSDPWLLWLLQDNTSMNFIYACTSDEGVKVETSLIIESTMYDSKRLCSLQTSTIRNRLYTYVREIDILLTELAK